MIGTVLLFLLLLAEHKITGLPAPIHSSTQTLQSRPANAQYDELAQKLHEETNDSRTLITVSILRWIMSIIKTIMKPAREIYLAMKPEITAAKCLSATDAQNLFQSSFYEHQSEDYYHSDGIVGTPRLTEKPLTDTLLRRMPRFVDEVASMLKDGKTMGCMVPYMRERIVRWLDA